VRLVEDHGVVLRKDPGRVRATAQSQVGEVESVVRDHELRVGGPLAGGLGEADADEGATAAEAAVAADGDLGPDRIRWFGVQLRPVAGLGRIDPAAHRLERRSVRLALEQLAAEQPEALESVTAEVVLTALEYRDLDVPPEGGRRDRHVLCQQLLLQRLGRRRDDHALPRLEGRDQVREALTGAGACLREQMLAAGQCVRDRSGEHGLLGSGLVAGEHPLEAAAGAEECFHECKRTAGRGRRNVCSVTPGDLTAPKLSLVAIFFGLDLLSRTY